MGNIQDDTPGSYHVPLAETAREKFVSLKSLSSYAFSPDGQLALTLSGGATSFGFFGLAARFWDVTTGQEVRQLEGYAASQVGSNITAAAFSPDGRWALTVSAEVRLWDVAKGQEVRRLEGFSSEVRSVTFSPDGLKALTADTGGAAHLWDMTTGQEVRRFQGAGSIETALFSPDGRFMLTGGEDFAPPRLFDITNGQEVLRFGQEEDVDLVAFSPDGRLVATVGKNDARL